jgi:hypothetical protein
MGRRGALIVLLTALTVVFAGCSGDDEPAATPTAPTTTSEAAPPTSTGAAEQPSETTTTAPPPTGGETADPAVIADAAGQTAAAGSAKVKTNVRVTDPGRGQIRYAGNGVFDFEQRKGQMALRLLEGDEGAFGDRSKAVFVDTSAYYQLPPGALGGGKTWIRLDLQNIGEVTGVDLGPLVQGSQADPSQYLLWLSAIGPGVTRIGEEEVRGVPTTRYRAVVDLNLLESQAPPGKEAEWAAYVQSLRDRLGLDFIPVEVWVDEEGLIRRLHHEYGFAAEGTSAIVTTELFDFGTPVNAKAPPAGQVAVLDDLIRP